MVSEIAVILKTKPWHLDINGKVLIQPFQLNPQMQYFDNFGIFSTTILNSKIVS